MGRSFWRVTGYVLYFYFVEGFSGSSYEEVGAAGMDDS
jgi:hypothetical protein